CKDSLRGFVDLRVELIEQGRQRLGDGLMGVLCVGRRKLAWLLKVGAIAGKTAVCDRHLTGKFKKNCGFSQEALNNLSERDSGRI
ncbi:MAG: hypothetical protein WBG63_20345, partial [Phormidesmis sp.]